MATPRKGDTVMFRGMPVGVWQSSPAVVTHVFLEGRDTSDGPVRVNLTVFPDGGAPVWVQGVNLFDTVWAATQERDECGRVFAAWPREEVAA